MSKIKMAKINPEEFRREVQGLLDIDPSGEMFCQILRATQELIHRAALYSDEGKDGWGEDLHHLTDTISDKIQNCSEHTIDELRSGYEYFMKGESSVITETADLINNIGYAHLSNMSKSNLKEGRRDWMEYLSDSLIDFWLSAAGVSSTEVFAVDECDGELVQVAPLSQRHLARLRSAGYGAELFAPVRSGR